MHDPYPIASGAIVVQAHELTGVVLVLTTEGG